jgi:hypothetical protein
MASLLDFQSFPTENCLSKTDVFTKGTIGVYKLKINPLFKDMLDYYLRITASLEGPTPINSTFTPTSSSIRLTYA